jgi:hypothetical protein
VTAGCVQPRSGGGLNDAFIVHLDPTGSRITYGTYLGGGDADGVYALKLDASGAIYATGQTRSPNFPVTAGAFQRTFLGSSGSDKADGFAVKLRPDGSGLENATFLGSRENEWLTGLAVDPTAGRRRGDDELHPVAGSIDAERMGRAPSGPPFSHRVRPAVVIKVRNLGQDPRRIYLLAVRGGTP